MNKSHYLNLIKDNITNHGFHLYSIKDCYDEFDYIYSIGLTDKIGFELIIAGWINFDTASQVLIIRDVITQLLKSNITFDVGLKETLLIKKFAIDGQDIFLNIKFDSVTDFWVENLMMGALDYYQVGTTSDGSDDKVKALQILPKSQHYNSLTIPMMSESKVDLHSPIWQSYLDDKYADLDKTCRFYVDEMVLKGAPILEVSNFDDVDWQVISYDSRNETNTYEIYTVSLCTILTIDNSIAGLLDMKDSETARRESIDDDWYQ